jgi:amino acid adenylation domain-containing protein
MIPLSYAQQRLWLLDQIDGPGSAYNVPMAMRLRGPLNRAALRAALTDVIHRHESLRTVFPQPDGQPQQQILDAADVRVDLPVQDCPESGLAEVIAGLGRQSFDLGREIPLRARLLAVSGQDHVLVLVMHHIAGDGWSFGPLSADLATAYSARIAGQAPGWPDLPVQYADYTLWQRELLGSEHDPGSLIARQTAFWSGALAGMPEELNLPSDRPRPQVPSRTGGVVSFHIGARAHTRLAGLARSAGGTLFMVVQAGLAALLTRLGAGTDIPIGSPVAGRDDEALEDLVGFFVNTLVLRTDTSGDPSFRDLLDRVRATDLTAYAHQDVPFERLVEVLNPARSLARHPLFQVMLTMQNHGDRSRLNLPGLDVSVHAEATGTAKFDLQVGVIERDGEQGLDGGIEYSADLFDHRTAELIGARLTRLLEAAAADPDRPIGQINLLSPDERQRILAGQRGETRPVPGTMLPGLIRAQAARTPDSIAVTGPAGAGTELSYAGLVARAGRLAARLARYGAGRGQSVALLLPRSPELVVAMLASHFAGAAYVPVDPQQPAERIGYVLGDARPAVVVTTRAGDGAVTGYDGPVVLADEPARAGDPDGEWPAMDPEPGDPAYLIYTSGSTGRPKGVVIEHHALASYLSWCRDTYPGLRQGSAVHTSPSYDMTVTALFGPLISGGTVMVAPGLEEVRAPGMLKVTPSHIGLLNSVAAAASPRTDLVVGGEALLAGQLTDWRATHPGVAVVNEYGPTEATVGCVIWRAEPGQDLPAGAVPIGRPVPNTRSYILDGELQPVPDGVPGELYLAGDQLARGYLNRPALTAERFVADPYGPPGSRMYRTGDLVRRGPDDVIDYLGRADQQLKIRGFRVEPGEVESVLAAHPAVAQAAVLVREDRPGDRRLVAYAVPAGPGRLDPAGLRAHAARQLPEHMVPATVVPIDELPVTANGKLDQGRLPAPRYAAGGQPPRTGRERVLCELFAATLGLPRVGIDDGFFELGGHSLLALRLIGDIRDRLGADAEIRDLFAHPTVAGLAGYLEQSDQAGPGQPGRKPHDRSRTDALGPVLALRDGGTAAPVFCLPPATGVAWVYAGLLEHIGAEHPVYGLQSASLAGAETAEPSWAAIVDFQLAQVRKLQPTGPYHLLGWSFGGTVAHALAARLSDDGAEVGSLTMLDSYPAGPASGGDPEPDVLRTLLASLGYQAGTTQQALAAARAPGQALAWLSEDCLGALVRAFAVNAAAQAAGRSGVFSGDALLFTSADGAAAPAAWRRHLGGRLRVHTVPVRHGQMTSPAAIRHIGPVLARRLPPGA